MYIPNSLWTWSFLVAVLVQLVICVGLEAYIFAEFELNIDHNAPNPPPDDKNTHSATATIPTYLTIFIFGFIYQLLLTYDALRLKNTIQVIGLCLYNGGMLIYSSVEIDQVRDAAQGRQRISGQPVDDEINNQVWPIVRPYLIATPCVIALFTVILSVIAWKLYGEFAWTIYKHISADVALKRRYLQYQIYIALLKFDFFFFLAFTVQFLVVTHGDVSTAEFAITIAAIPVSIGLLILAAYFTRRESYVGQTGVIALALAAMAYFIFKLVRMYEPKQAYKYVGLRNSLTTFAVLAILLLIVTIVAAVLCLMNFNKGLKPHIQNQKPGAVNDETGEYTGGGYTGPSSQADMYYGGNAHSMVPVGANSHRMEID